MLHVFCVKQLLLQTFIIVTIWVVIFHNMVVFLVLLYSWSFIVVALVDKVFH